MHAESSEHLKCIIKICDLRRVESRIDSELEEQCNKQKQYWYDVLRRVVAVVKLLTEKGLALRGDNEVLGSSHNGNFLGCMELIAQFHSFLAKHLSDHGNAGRGNPSFISSTIVEEFVEVMANEVRNIHHLRSERG